MSVVRCSKSHLIFFVIYRPWKMQYALQLCPLLFKSVSLSICFRCSSTLFENCSKASHRARRQEHHKTSHTSLLNIKTQNINSSMFCSRSYFCAGSFSEALMKTNLDFWSVFTTSSLPYFRGSFHGLKNPAARYDVFESLTWSCSGASSPSAIHL